MIEVMNVKKQTISVVTNHPNATEISTIPLELTQLRNVKKGINTCLGLQF